MHILIIDGSFFAQRKLHVGGTYTFKENPAKDKADFKRDLITSLCYEAKTIGNLTHVIFCLDSRSWRKDFKQTYPLTTSKSEDAQGYKKNREDKPKEYDEKIYYETYNEFVELIQNKYNVQILKARGAEADDACSIAAQQLTSLDPNIYCTVWSSDGDYPQMVTEQISLIKLPQKKVYRPVKKVDTSVMSIFGKKPDQVIKPLIEAYQNQAEYVFPKWSIFAKIVCGDGKDNVPCLWKWPSSTGTKFFSVTPKHVIQSIKTVLLNDGKAEDVQAKSIITEELIYDHSKIRELIVELMFITKQHTRLEFYDKKVHKIAVVQDLLSGISMEDCNIKEDLHEQTSKYLQLFNDFVDHSVKVYISNRKMKYLMASEIPEDVVSGIIESLKSSKKQANMEILCNVTSALQMVNLQETSSYFNMFNLNK